MIAAEKARIVSIDLDDAEAQTGNTAMMDEWMGDIRDDSPLHALWSKAKDHPDYDKSEWIALEKKFFQRNCGELFRLVDRALYLIDPMAIRSLTVRNQTETPRPRSATPCPSSSRNGTRERHERAES